MQMMEIFRQLTQPPSLEGITRALFIQPHPDDNQIAVGGTMASLVAKGVEVWELTVCDDFHADVRYIGMDRATTVTQRMEEVHAAQQVLGIKDAGFLGFDDKTHASVDAIADAILPVIRSIRPDAVFTVDSNLRNECHSDHIKVGQAVRKAVEDAPHAFYPTFIDGQPRKDTWTVPILGLYFTDDPNTQVDTSSYQEIKHQSIRAHASQADEQLLALIAARDAIAGSALHVQAAETMKLLAPLHRHCFTESVDPVLS